MSDRPGLTLREDFFDDPAGWSAFKDLLSDVFGLDIGPLDGLGGPDPSSMPSAYFDMAGRCVANFTAFSLPLMIDGRMVKVAGLQSGAVRPEYRGRGLFRDLIRRTLERCDARGFEAVALYTDKPALYEPYGFMIVPAHRFHGPAPQLPDRPPSARTIDLGNTEDLALVRRRLQDRAPVSQRLAVTGQATMFLLNALGFDDMKLSHLPEQDAIAVWRAGENGAFELLDVVAPQIPTLTAILQALGIRPAEVTVTFPPDRLDWNGSPAAEEDDLHFMMRCDETSVPIGPARLSPMAEF